jgi:hypothetical protein
MKLMHVTFSSVGATVFILLLPSCSSLLRENVLATTATNVGFSLNQNPESGLYELTLGYRRGEFFFVPTSKRVVEDGEKGDGNDDPCCTPEVLAVIGASGNAEGSQAKGTIGQALAVGKRAVVSPVAIAAFARDPETAKAAAEAVTGKALEGRSEATTRSIIALGVNSVAGLRTLAREGDASAITHCAALDKLAQAIVPPAADAEYRWDGTAHSLAATASTAPTYQNIEDVHEHLRKMNDSLEHLNKAASYLEKQPTGTTAPFSGGSSGKTTIDLNESRSAAVSMKALRDYLARELATSASYGSAMKYFATGSYSTKE